MVYRLLTKGTFEEKINEMMGQKKQLANMTVATGESWIGDMSTKQLQKLFSLSEKE